MSVEKRASGRWLVRYRDETGRHRGRTFDNREDATLFNAEVRRAKQLDTAFRSIEVIAPSRARRSRGPSTHVYVVAGNGSVKIGVAAQPRERVAQLRTASSEPLVLVRTIRADEAVAIERALHRRYAKHRRSGEWFNREPVLDDLMQLADDELVAMARNLK